MSGATGGGRPRSGPAAVLRVARTSTVDLIARELRHAVYSGALAVGQQLGEVEIAAQLGVSRSPLREAAQRLVAEGLLTSIPGRGLRVPRIGAEEIEDVYTARLAVEAEAARVVIARGEAEDLQRLDQAVETLREASRGDSAREIGDADLAFHQLLTDLAGSARLSRAMANLAIQTRIASFSVPGGYSVPRAVSATYAELLDALRGGDAERTVVVLRAQFADAAARLRGDGASVDTVGVERDEQPLRLCPIGEGEDPAGS